MLALFVFVFLLPLLFVFVFLLLVWLFVLPLSLGVCSFALLFVFAAVVCRQERAATHERTHGLFA